VEYVRDYLTRVGQAIRTRDFESIERLIDVYSFADFYIIRELYKDVDAGARSMLLQIKGQGEERRLHLGPIWDFDHTAGMRHATYRTEGWRVAFSHYWFENLMQTPEFYNLVAHRWNTLTRTAVQATIEEIGVVASHFQADFERNFERHPNVLGVGVREGGNAETVAITTFMGQVDFLTSWLTERAVWLDNQFSF